MPFISLFIFSRWVTKINNVSKTTNKILELKYIIDMRTQLKQLNNVDRDETLFVKNVISQIKDIKINK